MEQKSGQFATPLALSHEIYKCTMVKMVDRAKKLIKAQELFLIL